MATTIAGTCYIKMDGEQLNVEGSVSFPLMEVSREAMIGSTGVAGYKETPVTPYLKCNVFLSKGFPLEKLRSSSDMTITAECANGIVFTLKGAWLKGGTELNVSDGTTTLEFEGEKMFIQQN